MTRTRRPALLVLALVVGLLATACGPFGTPDGYLVQARFPRTFNLFPGSPVQVLGIDRGIVETLEVEEGSGTVVANLRMESDVQLPADVRAVVLTDALLGERYVQLDPPYDGGETFEPGGMIEDVGDVPAEFDELLDALNDFVEGIQGGDLPRLVDNLAEVLDDNGDDLGDTLVAARDALDVLRDYDEDIIRLAGKLADVNETLNTRRSELTQVIRDFSELSRFLADQRAPLDESLSSLARLADETGRLLDTNRTLVERDVATITRLGRTAQRNLDHLSSIFLNSGELFRHAERVIDRERNWLPLVNNTDQLGNHLLETTQDRLGLLCEREGLDSETCAQLVDMVDGIAPEQICLPPLLECTDPNGDGAERPISQPLDRVLSDTLQEGVAELSADPDDRRRTEEFVDDVVGRLRGDGAGTGDPTGSGGAP